MTKEEFIGRLEYYIASRILELEERVEALTNAGLLLEEQFPEVEAVDTDELSDEPFLTLVECAQTEAEDDEFLNLVHQAHHSLVTGGADKLNPAA